jgi:LCP family protein required for cell wall assembly
MHRMLKRIQDTLNDLIDRFLQWTGARFKKQAAPVTRPAGAPGRSLKLPYFLLAGSLGMVCVCCGLYLGVRSYAPFAAPPAEPTLTATPFMPALETLTPYLLDLGPSGADFTPDISPLLTPTPSISNIPWAPYLGPIYPALTAIPRPEQEFPDNPDILNVAVLGSDMRPTGIGGFRTDTIIILTLNRAAKTASLVSFPRDLYVYIPGYGMDRINSAFPEGITMNYTGGGFGLFRDTMKYNFGLTVHHYALINFWGFRNLIDQMGGIDVNVAIGIHDTRQGYPNGYGVSPGIHHMDGETALWYVRSRYTSSDYDRVRRQQEILLGIAQGLLNKNVLANIPGYYVTLKEFVESDLTLEMVTPYAELGASVSLQSIQRSTIIPPAYARDWITPDGKMVALPNYDAIHTLLNGLLGS